MAEGFGRNVVSELVDFSPTQVLDLFLIYYQYPDNDFNFVAISPSSNGVENGIIWQGVQYLPMPIETEGFRTIGEQELPKPKIRISNKDFFISRYISRFGDLTGKRVVRKRVFAKFLDDANFKDGNPFKSADPEAGFPDEIYYINRKSQENKSLVEFELSTPLEMKNYKIPSRAGYARYCTWIYRGYGCRYAGQPRTRLNGSDFSSNLVDKGKWRQGISYSVNDYVYVENTAYLINKNENEVDIFDANNSEGLRTFFVCKEAHSSTDADLPSISDKWEKDACGKKIEDCDKRFNSPLPYGGFPGTYEYKTQLPK